MSEDSSFDMNALLRGEARGQDEERSSEPQSIGGKSDAGAGESRTQPSSRDMNAWLREAVHETRERPS